MDRIEEQLNWLVHSIERMNKKAIECPFRKNDFEQVKRANIEYFRKFLNDIKFNRV